MDHGKGLRGGWGEDRTAFPVERGAFWRVAIPFLIASTFLSCTFSLLTSGLPGQRPFAFLFALLTSGHTQVDLGASLTHWQETLFQAALDKAGIVGYFICC